MRNAYRLVVGKPRERTLGRRRRRWMDNIKMDVGEIGWGDVHWNDLALDSNQWRAVMNDPMNFWFHKMFGIS
jgi:hypothetical protein